MRYKIIAELAECSSYLCPRIYRTDRKTFIVQGKNLQERIKKKFNVPDDENIVEVPEKLIKSLVNALKK